MKKNVLMLVTSKILSIRIKKKPSNIKLLSLEYNIEIKL